MADRSLIGKIGAEALHAQGKTNTTAGREAFERRFLDEVDPERVLPEAERLKRAEHARKLYYLRLSKAAKEASQEKRGAK